MKSHFPFRKIFLFICLCAFVSMTAAQEKPKALKFDEFDDVVENPFYSDDKFISFRERVDRFSKQLEKESGVTAYLIYYQARVGYENLGYWGFVNQVKDIENKIKYNERIKVEDIVIVDGGYRENNTVEFWIVPKNAEPPAPRPTAEESEAVVCPNIKVYGEVPLDQTDAIKFSISTYSLKNFKDYSLMWKVSDGEIVGGQETNEIEVRLNNAPVKQATAFVEINGLPYPCQKVFSTSEEITNTLRLIDSFGAIANGDTKARLDGFLTALYNYPTTKGYIIVYGNRAEKGRDVARRTTLIKKHFADRRANTERITIIEGGFRDEDSSELWLSFDDSEKPVLKPTVNEKFVIVPKLPVRSRPRKR